jgi:oligopeptide transport system ATP-binding protein
VAERLLDVKDLSTHFFTYAGIVKAVNGVSFSLDRGQTLGIVGESGSGKTVTAMSIMRLVPDPPGRIVAGEMNLKVDVNMDVVRTVVGLAQKEIAAKANLNGTQIALDGEEVVLRAADEDSLKAITRLLLEKGSHNRLPLHAAALGAVEHTAGGGVCQRISMGRSDMVKLTNDEMRVIRGNDIAMIFQDPMTSLNPVFKVGDQIVEAIRLHQGKNKKEAWQQAAQLLAKVGIPDADKRVRQFPHEFSGGMRQRAMIAMAISCNPKILIADEPTTALDVTIQAQIIEVVKEMQAQYDSGVILITHDLGVVAEMSDKIMVMYGGRTVEFGPVDEIFYNPHHPYTWGLLGSLPRLDLAEKTRLTPIKGSPPDLLALAAGCPFSGRCSYERLECRDNWPVLETVGPDHGVHCWIPLDERVSIRSSLPRFKETAA